MPRALIVLSASLAALTFAGEARSAPCPQDVANRLSGTGSATQLITVVAPTATSTRATVRIWRKAGECWRPADSAWSAWVGARGVSENKREGDRRTPSGLFGIGPTMLGIAANPGVRFRYRKIVCGDWWVEDPRSRWYNRFFHARCGAAPPFRTVSEDLSRYPTQYRHLAVITYNADPVVPGRGSGIFLHVSAGRPTLGCVSLPLTQLVRVLRWLDPAARPAIAIGTPAQLRRY